MKIKSLFEHAKFYSRANVINSFIHRKGKFSGQDLLGKFENTTAIIDESRGRVLNALPKNGNVCEIGVARGAFSQALLRRLSPRKLHLIDPWEYNAKGYRLDSNNVAQREMENRYLSVRSKYENKIKSNIVTIHRGYSEEIMPSFPDEFFDVIYVDGNHTYDYVMNDLELSLKKLRSGGFLCGHDYSENKNALRNEFGVVKAVNEFCRTHGLPLLAITKEYWPSFFICKTPNFELEPARNFIEYVSTYLTIDAYVDDITEKSVTTKKSDDMTVDLSW